MVDCVSSQLISFTRSQEIYIYRTAQFQIVSSPKDKRRRVNLLMIIHESDSVSRAEVDDGIVENGTKVIMTPSFARIVEVVVQWDIKER